MRPYILHGHSRSVSQVKYNRDGDLLFTTSKDRMAHVWRTENGERLGSYEAHMGALTTCDVSFDTTSFLTGGSDMTARIWDTETGQNIHTLQFQTLVRSVAFGHGNKTMLVVTDKAFGQIPAIYIYNLPSPIATKVQWNPLKQHQVADVIHHAIWGPTNDTIYFACDDGHISIYDLRLERETLCADRIHTAAVKKLAWTADYTCLATASSDKSGKLLMQTKKGDALEILKSYDADVPLNAVSVSSIKPHVILGGGTDARDVTVTGAASQRFETKFYHMVYQKELGSLPGHFGPVNDLEFHPLGLGYTSGGEDGFVRLHNFDSTYFALKDDYEYPDDDLSGYEREKEKEAQ